MITRIYNILVYKQLVENAARITTDTITLIDHLATTEPKCVSGEGVIPCGIIDHDAIFLIRSMKIPRVKKNPTNQEKVTKNATQIQSALNLRCLLCFSSRKFKFGRRSYVPA